MTARTFLFIAAALLRAANATSRADEAPAAPNVAVHREAIKSINAEIENSVAIFREAVKMGKEEDGWREDVKESARQWVKNDPRITPPPPPTSNDQAGRQAAMAFMLRMNGAAMGQSNLPWPAAEVADWLLFRVTFLNLQKRATLAEFDGELSDLAEESWLKANKPADLRSVVAAFADLEALAPRYLAQTILPYPAGFPGQRFGPFSAADDPRRAAAFYAALLTAGDHPLILPNPKTNVEEFTKARVTWSLLLQCNVSFQTRPRVAARVKELDDEYAEMRASAQQRLNVMILENAPPDSFEPALNYFNAFLASFDPQRWGLPPQRPMPMMMPPMMVSDGQGRVFPSPGLQGGQIHDYHDLLVGHPGVPTGGNSWALQEGLILQRIASMSAAGPQRAYREWLEYRRAQTNGAAPDELKSLWGQLRERLVFFPSEVKASIEKHRALPRVEDVIAAPGSDPARQENRPIEELIAALEAASARVLTGGSANEGNDGGFQEKMKHLLEAWRSIQRKEPQDPRSPQSDNAAPVAWQALAGRTDGLKLFSLREKTVRAALAQLPSQHGGNTDETVPIRKTLEVALEKCVTESDWTSLRYVLRLDSAANLLTGAERLLWKQIADESERASGEAISSPETARYRYREILGLSDDPALTKFAVRRLKELATKEAP